MEGIIRNASFPQFISSHESGQFGKGKTITDGLQEDTLRLCTYEPIPEFSPPIPTENYITTGNKEVDKFFSITPEQFGHEKIYRFIEFRLDDISVLDEQKDDPEYSLYPINDAIHVTIKNCEMAKRVPYVMLRIKEDGIYNTLDHTKIRSLDHILKCESILFKYSLGYIECEILTNISYNDSSESSDKRFIDFLFQYKIGRYFAIELKCRYFKLCNNMYIDIIFGKTEDEYIYRIAERINNMTVIFPRREDPFGSIYLAISDKGFEIPCKKFEAILGDYIFHEELPDDKYKIHRTKAACKK